MINNKNILFNKVSMSEKCPNEKTYGSYVVNKKDNTFVIESAYVHRCTSYIASLHNNWAYTNSSNVPKLKNSLDVKHRSDSNKAKDKANA